MASTSERRLRAPFWGHCDGIASPARCPPAPLKIHHFFLSLIRCAPALGTSPSPSFEGGFSDGGDESRVHSETGDVRHPQPPWKGGFRKAAARRECSFTPPAASENPNLLRDPNNPQAFAHRACDVQPTTQCRSTILPREDLIAKNSSPSGGGREGVKARPCQGATSHSDGVTSRDVMNLEGPPAPGPLPRLSREAFPIALAPLATIAGP